MPRSIALRFTLSLPAVHQPCTEEHLTPFCWNPDLHSTTYHAPTTKRRRSEVWFRFFEMQVQWGSFEALESLWKVLEGRVWRRVSYEWCGESPDFVLQREAKGLGRIRLTGIGVFQERSRRIEIFCNYKASETVCGANRGF